ncbi:MAG TPA: terminase family protein [Bryobacteraceae bacterium]|nr:terminase family protein [Bryobacteraceae bacterium]
MAWNLARSRGERRLPGHRKLMRAARANPHDAVAWAQQKLGFIADPKQAIVLSAHVPRGILNCSRQWGKSTTCAIKAVHFAEFHPDSLIVVAGPSLRQSGEFLRKAQKAVAQLGYRVRGDGTNNCSLLLPNGARIVGLPESEDTIRGFSAVDLMMIDEASRVSDQMYHALRPMLAVGAGALWLLSTPNGKTGFFYREWSGTKQWERVQAAAEDCPRIPKDFLEEERMTLSEEDFRREYNCEFLPGEGALFDEAEIRARISDRVVPLW